MIVDLSKVSEICRSKIALFCAKYGISIKDKGNGRVELREGVTRLN